MAIVPHRSLLIVGGDGDDRCLRRLVDAAKGEFEASARRLSPALYASDAQGRVRPLELSSGHLLAPDLALARLTAGRVEYEIQKAFLDQHLEEDVYIASYQVFRGRDGSPFSCSVWSRDVLTLLPETEQVALNLAPKQQGVEALRVSWRTLRDAVGDALTQEPHHDPPLWRTTAWPTDAQLVTLPANAVR